MPELTPRLIAVMGPTAAGKTALAEALADYFEATLINADAFQVYRGFDIGTSKPESKDRYRLLDICEPADSFGVGEWVQLAQAVLWECWEQHRSAIVVGGTGLYIRALMEEWSDLQGVPDPELRSLVGQWSLQEGLEGLLKRLDAADPSAGQVVDRKNPARVGRALERAMAPQEPICVKLPPFQQVKFALTQNLPKLHRKIAERVARMLQNGWIEEVQRLWDSGVPRRCSAMRAIGYGEIWDGLETGNLSASIADTIIQDTRQYAKRQLTWLRSEPRLTWIEADYDEVLESVLSCESMR